MTSSKEILQFRRILLNPVSCQQFQLFVSLKGDFLENDVRFWVEVQKYKVKDTSNLWVHVLLKAQYENHSFFFLYNISN